MHESEMGNLSVLPREVFFNISQFFSRLTAIKFLLICKYTRDTKLEIFLTLCGRDYPDYYFPKQKITQEDCYSQYKILYLFSLLSAIRFVREHRRDSKHITGLGVQLNRAIKNAPSTKHLHLLTAWIYSFLALSQIFFERNRDTIWANLRWIFTAAQLLPVVDANINYLCAKLKTIHCELPENDYLVLKKIYKRSPQKSIATLLGKLSPSGSRRAIYWLSRGNAQALRDLAMYYFSRKKASAALVLADKNNILELKYSIYKEGCGTVLADPQMQQQTYQQMVQYVADHPNTSDARRIASTLYEFTAAELKQIGAKTTVLQNQLKYVDSISARYFNCDLESPNYGFDNEISRSLERHEYRRAFTLLYSIVKQEKEYDEFSVIDAHLGLGTLYCRHKQYPRAANHFFKVWRRGDVRGVICLYQLMHESPSILKLVDSITVLQTLILANIKQDKLELAFPMTQRDLHPVFPTVLRDGYIRMLVDLHNEIAPTVNYSIRPPSQWLEEYSESKDSRERAMALIAQGIIYVYLNQDNKMAEPYFKLATQAESLAAKEYLSSSNRIMQFHIREKFKKILVASQPTLSRLAVSQNHNRFLLSAQPVKNSQELLCCRIL